MAILSFVLILLLIAADQLIKYLCILKLQPIGSVEVIPGLLKLTYVENRGAALGILQDQRIFFIVITIVFCIILFYILYFYRHHDFFSRFACIVIIAGGVGNLVDRIRLHFVVDYISVSFYSPVFNFADICVVAGVIAALIHILFTNRDKKREEEAETAPEVSTAQTETPSQLPDEALADRKTEQEQEKAAEPEKGALDEQNTSDHGAGE